MFHPVSRDFSSLYICFQCQQTFAHPVYASSVNRLLLILYMLAVQRDSCSLCICLHCQIDFASPCTCFQCQQTFGHPVYAPHLMRNVSCWLHVMQAWSQNLRWRSLRVKNILKYTRCNISTEVSCRVVSCRVLSYRVVSCRVHHITFIKNSAVLLNTKNEPIATRRRDVLRSEELAGVVWRSQERDAPFSHQQHFVDHCEYLRRGLVDGRHHGLPLQRHALQHQHHILSHERVQTWRRLIAEHQRWISQHLVMSQSKKFSKTSRRTCVLLLGCYAT